MASGPRRSRFEAAAMRASATAEGGARLTVSIMAGEVALDGRGGMISGTKAKLTPLCRRNRRLRPQKNPHYSGMGWVWSLNLRIQGFIKGDISFIKSDSGKGT